MSSNYEWQKFQAGERVQARRREAEAHRQVRREHPRPALALPASMALLIGVALVVWLLAGCTATAAPVTAAPARMSSLVGPARQLAEPDAGADHRLSVAARPASVEGDASATQAGGPLLPASSLSVRHAVPSRMKHPRGFDVALRVL
jgi:hypothetical protein